jgi:predicted CoA-binding protein
MQEIFLTLKTAELRLCYTNYRKKEIMSKKTLVLGATTNPARYANAAINRLVSNNIPTVGLGLRRGEVAGVAIENEKIPFEDIHTVTLYIGPQRQDEYYDYIVSLKPRRVIFNPGTENPEFYRLLQKNNIEVEVACTLILLSTQQYKSKEG